MVSCILDCYDVGYSGRGVNLELSLALSQEVFDGGKVFLVKMYILPKFRSEEGI